MGASFHSYYSVVSLIPAPVAQEVEALMQLSSALGSLIKTQAMQYVKAQVIKRTVFAALFAALSPTAWLKIGQIIGACAMTDKGSAPS